MASDSKISQLSALGAEPADADEFAIVDSSAGSNKKVKKSDLLGNYIKSLKDDSTPQLGGDLDLNGNNIDFPTTKNISDVLDEDDLSSNSATALATQQSIKNYVDSNSSGAEIDLDLGNDDSLESTDMDELATSNDTNNIVTNPTGDKALIDMGKNWPTSDEVAINSLTSHGSSVAGSDEVAIADVDDSNNIKKTTAQDIADLGGGGQKITLDIDDDGSNESTDLGEIATTNDTNNIATEDSADKLLFDFSKNYPTADNINNGTIKTSSGNIQDSNSNELLSFTKTSSAVNEITIKNQASSSPPEIQATGDDTNIDLKLVPKGTGEIQTSADLSLDGGTTSITSSEINLLDSMTSKTGSDTNFVTGTAGTDGNVVKWNADGDVVDTSTAVSNIVTPSSTDTFTNKTFDANGTGNSLSNVEVADLASGAKSGGGSTLPTALTKNITVEDSNGLTNSENITIFFTNRAITVTELNDVIQGSSSPSIDYDIHHASARDSGTPNAVIGTDRSVSSTSGSSKTTSFNDADIPADSWVWLVTSSVSGTVTELSISLKYTID